MIEGTSSPIQQAEKVPITIDCTKSLPSGGSVSSCIPTTRNATTGVDTTATNVTGAVSVASPLVTQFIHQVTVDLILTFKVTYSDTRVLEHEIVIPHQEF